MKKLSLTIIALSFAVAANADTSKVEVRASVSDGTTTVQDTGLVTKSFTTGVRSQQTVTLSASSFTQLSKPSGAKGLAIDWGTVSNVKLKGLTGDQGISMDSTVPLVLPLSLDNTSTIGFQNMSASDQEIVVQWL